MPRKTDWQYAIDELQAYANKACEEAAKHAQKLLTEKAQELMDKYYDEYSQNRYDRTNNLHDNAIKPLYNLHGTNHMGGVTISSEAMEEYKKLVPDESKGVGILGKYYTEEIIPGEKNKVVDNWFEGIHPNAIPERFTGTPTNNKEALKAYRDEIAPLCANYGKAQALRSGVFPYVHKAVSRMKLKGE